MNNNNFGIYVGRLVKDPVFFENADKSHVVVLNVACRQNFASGKDKEYQSDFVEFRGFIPKSTKNNGIYGYLTSGDKISIQYSLRSAMTEKKGKKNYFQTCNIESVQIEESKTVRERRREEKSA